MIDKPIKFMCGKDELIGIISSPNSRDFSRTGVIIAVGGPQYRVGSHRQFVTLSRFLALQGYYVFRFDYRGMGDSDGEAITFEEAGPDICAAIDTLMQLHPEINSVVLWGLCDAATISLIYSCSDNRVKGLVLLNPWVRTETGKAKAELKHYYAGRFFEKEFWYNLVKGKVNIWSSFKEIAVKCKLVILKKNVYLNGDKALPLPERVKNAFLAFNHKILLIISTNDLTASEFMDFAGLSKDLKDKLNSKDVELYIMQDADHTFSRQSWKNDVEQKTVSWLKQQI